MVRNPSKLICLAALLASCQATSAAPRSGRRLPSVSPNTRPKGVSAGTRPSSAAGSPRRGATRLSAGARGPAGVVADEKAALEIPDLRTQANVASVIQALQELKGVKAAVVDLNTHLAVVDYDPRVTELDRFLSACKEAGFEASEYRVESRFPKPIKLKGG